MTIRGNTFRECAYNSGRHNFTIAIEPEVKKAAPGHYVHRNIRITGNTFVQYDYPILFARSTDGLTFTGNRIERTQFLPAGPRSSWTERAAAIRDIWAVALLFVFIIGGLYGGLFTATEAAGAGDVETLRGLAAEIGDALRLHPEPKSVGRTKILERALDDGRSAFLYDRTPIDKAIAALAKRQAD